VSVIIDGQQDSVCVVSSQEETLTYIECVSLLPLLLLLLLLLLFLLLLLLLLPFLLSREFLRH
jgi:hypothetical protein